MIMLVQNSDANIDFGQKPGFAVTGGWAWPARFIVPACRIQALFWPNSRAKPTLRVSLGNVRSGSKAAGLNQRGVRLLYIRKLPSTSTTCEVCYVPIMVNARFSPVESKSSHFLRSTACLMYAALVQSELPMQHLFWHSE
jgi:hypothetical protein